MRLSTEARVGLLITVSFTIFIVLVGVLAKFSVSKTGYSIGIYFSFLNDLRVGAPVKIGGGIKIGQVEEIKQYAEKTEVIVWIDNRFKLPKSTTFAIFTTGLIGEKYINVIVPALQVKEEYLKNGDFKYGLDPASFDRMMQTFQSFLQDQSGGEILANIFKNSNKFVENLNSIVNENRYNVKRSVFIAKNTIADLSVQSQQLLQQLNAITRNMADLSKENKEDISITLKNLSEMTSSLNKILYRLEHGRGTVGKLMSDEEIYNNLLDASIHAKILFRSLQKDPSKLLFKKQK